MRYFLEIMCTALLMTTFVAAQEQGDLCVVAETLQPGVCRYFLNCPGALEAAFQGKPPQACTSPENKLVVCCPWVPGQETGLETRCQANPTEGSNCTVKHTKKTGVCRPFPNCQTAKEAASRGILPQRCDLTDNESELVCCVGAGCPPLPKGLVTQLPTGSKAADYCIELAEKIHPCQETHSGWTRGNICPLLTQDSNIEYHRTPMTTTAEAPHYGQIGSGEKGNITWRESPVSLVSDRWVLCAAFAIGWIGSSNVQFVGLGGTFTPRYNPDETYGVTKQYTHPLYNGSYSEVYNNIALLRLDRRVTFTGRILPACLHTGTPLPNSGFILTARGGTSIEEKIAEPTDASYLDCPGFTLAGKFRPKGGVCLFSRADVNCVRLLNLENSRFDVIWVRVNLASTMTMQRLSGGDCSRVFPVNSSFHPDGVKHDQEICSRPVDTTGICSGWYFRGAPLTLPNSPRVARSNLLVGLLSYWNYPEVNTSCTLINTRISDFIPWIEGIVWPESGVVEEK